MEDKELTFEEANRKLEQVVGKMEKGNLTLRESVDEYAKACELLAFCMRKLENCRGRIININERIQNLKKIFLHSSESSTVTL